MRRTGRPVAAAAGADASVVRRSMAALQQREGRPAAHVSVLLTLPLGPAWCPRWYLALFQVYGALFQFLAGRRWGRSLLLAAPGFFSHGMFSRRGPSDQQLREASFSFTNFARGYSRGAPLAPGEAPDLQVVTRVQGPEPGYLACSIFVVQVRRVEGWLVDFGWLALVTLLSCVSIYTVLAALPPPLPTTHPIAPLPTPRRPPSRCSRSARGWVPPGYTPQPRCSMPPPTSSACRPAGSR